MDEIIDGLHERLDGPVPMVAGGGRGDDNDLVRQSAKALGIPTH